MSNGKKNPIKTTEELQTALQNLIAQGRKDGMIRAEDLNALLEKMDLSAEKIEEIYDRFEATNIQIIPTELELSDDELGLGDTLDDDLDMMELDEEDLVDPVRSACCPQKKKWNWPSVFVKAIRKPRTNSPKPTCVWWYLLPRNTADGGCIFWT